MRGAAGVEWNKLGKMVNTWTGRGILNSCEWNWILKASFKRKRIVTEMKIMEWKPSKGGRIEEGVGVPSKGDTAEFPWGAFKGGHCRVPVGCLQRKTQQSSRGVPSKGDTAEFPLMHMCGSYMHKKWKRRKVFANVRPRDAGKKFQLVRRLGLHLATMMGQPKQAVWLKKRKSFVFVATTIPSRCTWCYQWM